MRSFESVWNELQDIAQAHLKSGSPILTLERNTENFIVKVTDEFIERDSKGKISGTASKIRKSELRRIYDQLVKEGKVEPTKMGTLYFSYSLLSRIKEVSHTTNPLTLYWNDDSERAYYILGSKYGEKREVSVLPDMIEKEVVSVGFFDKDISQFYLKPESQIKEYLKGKNESPKSYNALKRFLQLKPGDIIAIKTSGSPRGGKPCLIIVAYAMVVQRNGTTYFFDPQKLGHCIHVEFIEMGFKKDYELGGYGRTIQRVEEQNLIDLIFSGYQPQHNLDIRKRIKKRRRKASFGKKTGSQQRAGTKPYVANLSHNELQLKFLKHLQELYGKENVKLEEDWVDIIVDLGSHVVFYEVKIYDQAEDCIKEGLGQLLSYGFFSDEDRERRYVIVGPSKPDDEELRLIQYLKENLSVEFEYLDFSPY